MKALAFLVLMAGLVFGSAEAVRAQTATSEAPAAASDVSSGGGSILTPEQIESLNSMVDQMKTKMQEMVQAAQETATQMSDGSKVMIITTNDLAVIAVGSLGGALIVDLLGGGGMATLAGAVVGGIGAHWFMTNDLPQTVLPTSG